MYCTGTMLYVYSSKINFDLLKLKTCSAPSKVYTICVPVPGYCCTTCTCHVCATCMSCVPRHAPHVLHVPLVKFTFYFLPAVLLACLILPILMVPKDACLDASIIFDRLFFNFNSCCPNSESLRIMMVEPKSNSNPATKNVGI